MLVFTSVVEQIGPQEHAVKSFLSVSAFIFNVIGGAVSQPGIIQHDHYYNVWIPVVQVG